MEDLVLETVAVDEICYIISLKFQRTLLIYYYYYCYKYALSSVVLGYATLLQSAAYGQEFGAPNLDRP